MDRSVVGEGTDGDRPAPVHTVVLHGLRSLRLTTLQFLGSVHWKWRATRRTASRRSATSSVCLMFLALSASRSSSPRGQHRAVAASPPQALRGALPCARLPATEGLTEQQGADGGLPALRPAPHNLWVGSWVSAATPAPRTALAERTLGARSHTHPSQDQDAGIHCTRGQAHPTVGGTPEKARAAGRPGRGCWWCRSPAAGPGLQ